MAKARQNLTKRVAKIEHEIRFGLNEADVEMDLMDQRQRLQERRGIFVPPFPT